MNFIKYFLILVHLGGLFFCGGKLKAQTLGGDEIRALALEKFPDALTRLMNFISLPNNGKNPKEVARNLDACIAIFDALEFETQVLRTDGAPLLFAHKEFQKNTRTILFYLQIDGQPVDTTAWDQPSPYIPVIKKPTDHHGWNIVEPQAEKPYDLEWRVFGRSASDSKGPAMSLISALEILKSRHMDPAFNISVIMDFQEELGSPDLAQAVKANKELLVADLLLIMDGTRHISNWPTLCYGARGIATASLRVFGPRYPLHSGQYGNYAPNPVFEAARLVAGLKDSDGRVAIRGFYDGIQLSERDKLQINSLPESGDSLKLRLGIARPERVGATYQEALQYPTLNIRGIRAAWVGKEVRTVIPDEVIIEFDLRLVPESGGVRLIHLLKDYITGQGYHLVDSLPTEEERARFSKLAAFNYRIGSLPFRTDLNSPAASYINRAYSRVFGGHVVNMRTTGGSQPIAPFVNTLAIPAISVRIPNPDNNIHAPNENLRLGNFMEGIIGCLAILTEPFD